jgi:arsenate reductase (thioredoxin)
MSVFPVIEQKINQLQKSFVIIPEKRKELLKETAQYISDKLKDGKVVNLIFICTHNSRRSHMTQIWAQTAAEYFRIKNINCFSGGTEATAFNPRAVTAVEKVGFKITKQDDSDNPVYLVYHSDESEPLKCFSKVYSDKFNPQKDFAAIMTCSDADENCPVVFGAEARFPIRYEDPKEFDDTSLQALKYTERFDEIGREMLFLFSQF